MSTFGTPINSQVLCGVIAALLAVFLPEPRLIRFQLLVPLSTRICPIRQEFEPLGSPGSRGATPGPLPKHRRVVLLHHRCLEFQTFM